VTGRSPDELVRLLRESLERAGQEREPPPYEQLEAYVDGRLDDVDREIVESGMADDPELRAEVDALRALRAELPSADEARRVVPFPVAPARRAGEPGRPRAVVWWQVAAAAAVAAAVVLAVIMPRAVAPPPTVAGPGSPPPADRPAPTLTGLSVRDRGTLVGLRTDGSLAGLDAVPEDLRGAVADSLRAGRLPASPPAAALAGRTGVLMDGARARGTFSVVGPLATAVATDRPTFRWRALAGATAYRVRVVDDTLATVAEGPPTTATTWQPRAALPRGRVLSWQVEAETPAGRRTTPAPPQPEARLLVLPAADADRATAALAAAPSDLAAAVIAAQAGLYDEADAALARLAAANPESATVATLRRELAARRGGG
jgi:hypothetical protein